jgi:hypothetical protein
MADDTRARLARLEAAGWERDTSARRGVVLCRVSQYGSGPDIASAADLAAAISKAEQSDSRRARALVAPHVYSPPAGIQTTPLIPTQEGVEADHGKNR